MILIIQQKERGFSVVQIKVWIPALLSINTSRVCLANHSMFLSFNFLIAKTTCWDGKGKGPRIAP